MRTTKASARASFGVTPDSAAVASAVGSKDIGSCGLGDVHDLGDQVVPAPEMAEEPVGDDGAEAAVAITADDEGHVEGLGRGPGGGGCGGSG